jgi:hypothetical protein
MNGNMQYAGDDEIIDVAYQTATDDELFRQKQSAKNAKLTADENEEALMELAREVMLDPERCFCRNCGQPVYKNASVCVHCSYVINPVALQQGQRLVRARRDQYESSKVTKVHRFIRNLTGIDLEPQQQKQRWAVRQQNYHYDTTGDVYCTNCGCIVDPGASVCVNCNYVLNPMAVRRAQMALSDKQAKFTKKDRWRCLLIPGEGFKMFNKFKLRRPQVAKPALISGIINSGALAAGAMILGLLLSQL